MDNFTYPFIMAQWTAFLPADREVGVGYMIGMAPCFGCHTPFAFNPDRVPSVVVNGVREPVCRTCVDVVNPIRIKNGLEPFRPLPGAYDEAEAV
jgi:hypothetical protein